MIASIVFLFQNIKTEGSGVWRVSQNDSPPTTLVCKYILSVDMTYHQHGLPLTFETTRPLGLQPTKPTGPGEISLYALYKLATQGCTPNRLKVPAIVCHVI